jgi:hypothetical protein
MVLTDRDAARKCVGRSYPNSGLSERGRLRPGRVSASGRRRPGGPSGIRGATPQAHGPGRAVSPALRASPDADQRRKVALKGQRGSLGPPDKSPLPPGEDLAGGGVPEHQPRRALLRIQLLLFPPAAGCTDYYHVTSFRGWPEQPVRDALLRGGHWLRTMIRTKFSWRVQERAFYDRQRPPGSGTKPPGGRSDS